MSTLDRRIRTFGRHAPLFYDDPLEFVAGSGVWLTDVHGDRYLDAYNNVPHVGHAHPRVVEAIREQASRVAHHTRYLNERVVEYGERLLATFAPELDGLVLTNSGSESNDLALRIATQHTGQRGILVSDYSYHGHTRALAELTTGLTAHEGVAPHVRTLRVPDLDGADRGRPPEEVLGEALEAVDAAIESLRASGDGIAFWLFDPLFSTEGLVRVPGGFVAAVAERVQRAGGLVVADEVQSGFGRTGQAFWGHELHGVVPDLVTMGKPMGNGHPVGGVVLSQALLEEFGSRNRYFNTFGGNPVSAAAGLAVLDVLRDEQLVEQAVEVGAYLRDELDAVAGRFGLGPVRGRGMFVGLGVPDGHAVVEGLKAHRILISRIGRRSDVLKVRPPMPFGVAEAGVLLSALETTLSRVRS